jgi:hypothetical protein
MRTFLDTRQINQSIRARRRHTLLAFCGLALTAATVGAGLGSLAARGVPLLILIAITTYGALSANYLLTRH